MLLKFLLLLCVSLFEQYHSSRIDEVQKFDDFMKMIHKILRISSDLSVVRISITKWKPSPNCVSIGFSQIAYPITVLRKDDHRDFAQEKRLGLPHWTMISAILCRGRRIQMSGRSDLWILSNPGASSNFTMGISRYCVSCLSCATWQSGHDIHDFGGCHLRCWWSLFSEYCVRPWIVFYNITSEYNSTFLFLVFLSPIQQSLNDRCPLMRRNELSRPTSLLHWSPVSYFWLLSSSTPKFSPIFPFLVHCCLCCKHFHGLVHKNKFVNQNVMLQWIVSFSCNMVFMMIR